MSDNQDWEHVKAYLGRDRFAAQCGISILEIGEGHATVRMEAGDEHLNSWGSVHGGALFTLADMAFAAAANSYGQLAVGINCTINFTRAAPKGALVAEAVEESRSPRIATYIIRIRREDGTLVATAQGMSYVKGTPIAE